ncbi:pSer/pThr/pTyr-binding forkhead associated (FHA) protein [Sediminihabitans luteus]|uniref:PSer/pThr/pTyr-binding forkhead associated (FHA) protein n=1 Tax=Sediminihabitans luteus TaxID=1138585 RepID=A0A2M9CQN6_9CELL|nr:FHA domain-containing protein [Sediminihabitans luteus]PJJ74236.1 pSer/pThr/pTyr-binding forkhead associated (FHA) protein [Sediminihabitans luteus]GII99089.1 hypothetical protein Slu03_14670 [Sediminihabitans luteus]
MTTPGEFDPQASSDTTISFGRLDPAAVEEAPQPGGLTAEENAAVAALPETSALLIVRHGPGAGARFLLDAERTVAGRSERADIFLDDVTVSRKHAEFVREGGRFVVRDIGSLNGTYLNRARIDLMSLTTGDEVQIGKFRLTFYAGQRAAAAPGAGGV